MIDAAFALVLSWGTAYLAGAIALTTTTIVIFLRPRT